MEKLSTEAQTITRDIIEDLRENPKVIHGLKPYYRRRQRDGSVKVWFIGERDFECDMVMAPEAAKLLVPNKPIILRYTA